MSVWKKIIGVLSGVRKRKPTFETNATAPRCERLVIEIPDALDPKLADEKYTAPLQRLLSKDGVGSVGSVNQGQANTPDEFSRFITVNLSRGMEDIEGVLDTISNFLAEKGAPAGTFLHAYDQYETKLASYCVIV